MLFENTPHLSLPSEKTTREQKNPPAPQSPKHFYRKRFYYYSKNHVGTAFSYEFKFYTLTARTALLYDLLLLQLPV